MLTLPAGLIIDTIGGYPCQAEGTMNGCPFYFRARHGEWTLDVVRPGCDPSWAYEGVLHHAEGDDDKNGYMEPEAAQAILIAEFAKMTF